MQGGRLEHPAVVRLCHWLSALAVIILAASGLEVFAAFPSFGDKLPRHDLFTPPDVLRLGGWLGGALQWHLTFAWVFLGAGITYVIYQTITGNYRQVLFARSDVRGVWPMARHYFLFGPRPPRHGTYNPLQKLAYSTAIAAGGVLAVTGLALYKPVLLSGIVGAMGGLRLVRIWHFAAMIGLAAFVPGHLIMVALHGWSNFASMWTGSIARRHEPFQSL